MRDLAKSGLITAQTALPKGLAFDVADIKLAKSCAGFHDYRLTIRLDHGSEHEEYEEILEFRQGWRAEVRFILWRNQDAVFIQPLPGRRQQFVSVLAALDSLHAPAPAGLTAIWTRDGGSRRAARRNLKVRTTPDDRSYQPHSERLAGSM